MSCLRGMASFVELWKRRTTVEVDGLELEVLSLPDLAAAKRTQREKQLEKDWLMTNRLVEAHHTAHQKEATSERQRFWLRESFQAEFLELRARDFPEAMQVVA
ncbi:MAG: hypothetical protein AAF555_09945 [Verrucomicrobiota bacterium]